MRFVIQVCSKAEVAVDHEIVGKIGRGFLVLLGIGREDTIEIADKMVEKMLKLRILPDENGKTNRSLSDVNGSLLLISQFTLYADCHHGNRPNFLQAKEPGEAEEIYEHILSKCKESVPIVEKGIFGADMQVSLTNEGPFTLILDSQDVVK
jgi:D-tyrosyl-tRNA(Tyr) deacylase